jgi:Fe-S cluster biogenesis protein NfuA
MMLPTLKLQSPLFGVLEMTENVEQKIQQALDEIRPQLQADGGDVQYVAFDKGTVKVRLQGHCAGCPMSMMTLKQGIESYLKKCIPQVAKVEAVQ